MIRTLNQILTARWRHDDIYWERNEKMVTIIGWPLKEVDRSQ